LRGPHDGASYHHRAARSHDVDVDSRGLVYIVDRYAGFDVLELSR